jgi:hypothetical protein
MRTAEVEIEDKIDELLVVLDEDIRHIEESLLRLNELRGLVVKRDETSLGKLLESIQAESDSYRKNELRRQLIRKELAAAFGSSIKQMTLSRLEEVLQEEKKTKIAERKARLKLLTEELRKEHSGTVLLLADCAQFNSLLLRSIFNFGNSPTVFYGSDGTTKRQTGAAFVNLQF